MKTRGGLKISRWAGAACAGLLLPFMAIAQEQPDSSASGFTLGEVVVTARKVEEKLQNIPMSVQALSGEYISETRATRLHELQFAVPGFVAVPVGAFADPQFPAPRISVFERRRHHWVDLSGLPDIEHLY